MIAKPKIHRHVAATFRWPRLYLECGGSATAFYALNQTHRASQNPKNSTCTPFFYFPLFSIFSVSSQTFSPSSTPPLPRLIQQTGILPRGIPSTVKGPNPHPHHLLHPDGCSRKQSNAAAFSNFAPFVRHLIPIIRHMPAASIRLPQSLHLKSQSLFPAAPNP